MKRTWVRALATQPPLGGVGRVKATSKGARASPRAGGFTSATPWLQAWRTCWAGLSSPIQWVFHQPPKGKDRPMNLEDTPALVIASFRIATVNLPNGLQVKDLFVMGRTTQHGPEQTVRLRLPPNMLHAVVQSLSEAAGERPPGEIQRLFEEASLTPVKVNRTGLSGFVLTMKQRNTSQGTELPVEMFVAEDQLAGLAELLNAALANRRSDGEPQTGTRH
jgi:hypothetical protein